MSQPTEEGRSPTDPRLDRDLGAMLDLLPERIARYRASDLTFLYCNAAKAADYDVAPEDLVGRRLEEVLPESSRSSALDQLRALGPDEPARRSVNQLRRPGEPVRWIEWAQHWEPGDGVATIVSIGRDITDAYERELALIAADEHFRVAMSDAPIGMAIVGLDHRLLRVNEALCEFLGRTEAELLELTTLDVTHPDDVGLDLDYGHGAGRLLAPEGLEKRYLRPDGTIVWGLLKVSTVHDEDGRPRHLIGQVVDITDRVRQRQDLERAAATERGVADRLRELDRVKNTFLTAVSHELRTPLTVVRGTAATLARLGDDADPTVRAKLEAALDRQAAGLDRLLDELLDIDRLARGTLTSLRGWVELVALVRRLVALSPVSATTTVRAPEVRWVHADEVQLERIVVNLLDNAHKYAPGSAVEVIIEEVGVDGFRLHVTDGGPGIPAAEHERIFEAFHRGPSEHPRPGTGIGLALVAEFARLHGGRAWAEPAELGAHLVVEFPDSGASEPDPHEPAETTATTGEGAGRG